MFVDFWRLQTIFGLKMAKSFQCARPLQGAPRAENEKNRSVFDETPHFVGPQQRINFHGFFFDFFGSIFFCHLGPGISQKTSTIAIFSKNSGEPPQRCQSKKIVQHERGSDEPKHSRWRRVTAKKNFVGWVPNRQNRSPTNKMAPSTPPNGHIPGPRDTSDPKQGSLGPHLARKQIW